MSYDRPRINSLKHIKILENWEAHTERHSRITMHVFSNLSRRIRRVFLQSIQRANKIVRRVKTKPCFPFHLHDGRFYVLITGLCADDSDPHILFNWAR